MIRVGNSNQLKHLFGRITFTWAAYFAGLIFVAAFTDLIVIHNLTAALVTAALIGLFNALLWPFVSFFTLKITVYTLGLFNFFLNGLILLFAIDLVPGVFVEDLSSAIWVWFGLTIFNIIVSAIFSIDDDFAYFENNIKKRLKTSEDIKENSGLIFLEIDGLSKKVLTEAIQKGYAPNIEKMLNTHNLQKWETGSSPQTGACQAGILHGNSKNMPAFRWIDKKDNFKMYVSNGPQDAPIIEATQSNGKGLLSINGGSRSNLFSGDATDAVFTYSKITDLKHFYNQILYAYFSKPYNFARTVILTLVDAFLEIGSIFMQRVKNVSPRLTLKEKGLIYPFLRGFTTVFLRDLTVYTIIGDIFIGKKDVIYSTFVGYDEVAHHSGIRDKEAFRTLKKLDKQFGRIQHAIKEADRHYNIVVLSDHGQSQGSTFAQRYNVSLEEFIKNIIIKDKSKAKVAGFLDNDESLGHKNLILNKNSKSKQKDHKNKDVIVMASGNLGIVYLTKWKTNATLEQINKEYPSLINELISHQGIGFILVNSKKEGPLVISNTGKINLKSGKVTEINPLNNFRPNSVKHLKRVASFSNAPDILINSFYDNKTQEGAAFEELIGFHGGFGGEQAFPFVLYPNTFEMPKEIVGEESLHKVFKKWANSTH